MVARTSAACLTNRSCTVGPRRASPARYADRDTHPPCASVRRRNATGRRRSFRRLSKTDSVKARKNDDRERDMRMPIIALFVIAAALLGETQVSNAQSPYSYPWCAIYSGGRGLGGAMSCYYTSWEQCRAWQARKLHLYAALLLFGRVVAMQHTSERI